MMVCGEVHTGLLQNSIALNAAACERLLGFLHGERVRRYERPMAYAVSPDVLTGVDCAIATASGVKTRGTGTVAARAMVTGGHVLQASALVQFARGTASHRQPWAHYLARPGRVELVGRADTGDLVAGFLAGKRALASLDVGAIAGRLLDDIQGAPDLDRRPPFRAARTELRWAAVVDDGRTGTAAATIAFRIESNERRSVRVVCRSGEVAGIAEFCEDLALHDWLLGTLLTLVARSGIGVADRSQVIERLRPAIDHLLHVWMPGARLDDTGAALWEVLERRPGFSRQWESLVNRIRDHLALSTVALLGLRVKEFA